MHTYDSSFLVYEHLFPNKNALQWTNINEYGYVILVVQWVTILKFHIKRNPWSHSQGEQDLAAPEDFCAATTFRS